MTDRRRLLVTLLASAATAALGAGPGRAAALGAATGAFPAAARRYGRFYIVDGWVLTARDLEDIRRHDR